ncbi:MAG TPA: hypothetical protein PLE61_11385 [Vicinamibacterales bacterium]|nr:hypothetical protein [Vicinamibacterales bacterium]HPW21403.1 hypothetical protein [Vicinamibacterales bacterium]
MNASRRQIALLAAILTLLAAVLYYQYTVGGASPEELAAAARRAPAAAAAGPAPARPAAVPAGIPAVDIAALERPQPEPSDTGRDPFHFGAAPNARAAAGPAGSAAAGPRGAAPAVTGPAEPVGPPPPPPITLKFIGTARQGAGRFYAVLRDDRGVYYGADGDVVEGRYKVISVSADFVVLSYVDGRGRVSLPLSGGQP